MSAYIGREFKKCYSPNMEKSYKLTNSIHLDFSRKEHTFIVAKSGGGKSYLVGVLGEEMISKMKNYAVVILDPMGVFSTLSEPNHQEEINKWNDSLKRIDIKPEGLNNFKIWVPAGDIKHFESDMYDEIFSLKAKDISTSMFCFAFGMDLLDPQARLYNLAMNLAEKKNPDFTLKEIRNEIRFGGEHHFKEQTVDALITKLDALEELKIISQEGISICDVVKENQATVFDLSMSPDYTSKLIVNFFSDQILVQRKKIVRKLRNAEKNGEKAYIKEYFPPTQLMIDEAHNFIPKNPILRKFIKEGRNSGCMLTAISQSPDLSKSIYANISNLFVGPLIFQDDIDKIRSMLPFLKSAKEFRSQTKDLDTGNFIYYNMSKKTEQLIRVRVRKTLHPSTTELKDERNYLLSEEPISAYDKFLAESITDEARRFLASTEGN